MANLHPVDLELAVKVLLKQAGIPFTDVNVQPEMTKPAYRVVIHQPDSTGYTFIVTKLECMKSDEQLFQLFDDLLAPLKKKQESMAATSLQDYANVWVSTTPLYGWAYSDTTVPQYAGIPRDSAPTVKEPETMAELYGLGQE